jgi:cell fate regulator YaaT (PSP1 superfamily)
LTEVVSVRFKNKGKVYFFDPAGTVVHTGESVIVETVKGLEFAECTNGNHFVEDTEVIPPLRPIVRVATEADIRRNEENREKESEAFEICQQKILKHEMDMKLVDVEYSFEGNKILFFFTSDGRVDFRDLVKDLASVFKTRIELRQIGVRDEARMIGGLGICGRPFCCSQFLDEFQPVSIKMAKTQGLSLNPTKISGTCGRLMCCLKYEQCAYESLVKKAPKVDAFVETPAGKGSVASVNLLRGNAKVRLEDQLDAQLKTFAFDEIEVLGGKAKRAEYLAAKAEGKIEEPKKPDRMPGVRLAPPSKQAIQAAEEGWNGTGSKDQNETIKRRRDAKSRQTQQTSRDGDKKRMPNRSSKKPSGKSDSRSQETRESKHVSVPADDKTLVQPKKNGNRRRRNRSGKKSEMHSNVGERSVPNNKDDSESV